ncbi:hypothetical protein SKAU_G00369380 [Synaphobranchus kaupii]|uniref:C2H2-type domain-containing protein n=1 Tax=Synaphobranchus kaupii TaxID=118154 RepID=A0A9Q1EFR1_SYNKA|nr:hypothetical protein SKAU_G00369380 [Synaphobranchus kaupii]
MQGRVKFGGMPEAECAPTLSPNRPVSAEYPQHCPSGACLDRKLNSSSPVQAESFPEPSLTINGSPRTFIPSFAEMTTKLGSMCSDSVAVAVKRPASSSTKAKHTNPKKHRPSSSTPAEKKQVYRDDVTTSPVLGLRIKESPDEDAKPRSNSPLGEFICQLCKERYSDPLTLAQHKCSRIVRVEYRCTECDKVFSCPANLASHRRWHKPRSAHTNGSSMESEDTPSIPLPVVQDQSVNSIEASTPSPQLSDPGSEEEMTFDCPQCCKKFRRQAYLRKHLALHNRQAAGMQQKGTHSTAKKARPIETGLVYLGRDSLITETTGAGELPNPSSTLFPDLIVPAVFVNGLVDAAGTGGSEDSRERYGGTLELPAGSPNDLDCGQQRCRDQRAKVRPSALQPHKRVNELLLVAVMMSVLGD